MVAPNTPPWQRVHDGKRWKDMPGTNTDIKKMNFYLFRKGLLVQDAKGGWWNRNRKTGQMELEAPSGAKDLIKDPILEEDNVTTLENETPKITKNQRQPMSETNKTERIKEYDQINEMARNKGLTMRQVSTAMGYSTSALVPSKVLEMSNETWKARFEATTAFLTQFEAKQEVPRPPELEGPTAFPPAPELPIQQPVPDPLDRIVELGQRIREMREEVRRLALAL